MYQFPCLPWSWTPSCARTLPPCGPGLPRCRPAVPTPPSSTSWPPTTASGCFPPPAPAAGAHPSPGRCRAPARRPGFLQDRPHRRGPLRAEHLLPGRRSPPRRAGGSARRGLPGLAGHPPGPGRRARHLCPQPAGHPQRPRGGGADRAEPRHQPAQAGMPGGGGVLEEKGTLRARVLEGCRRLLAARAGHPAFHPPGASACWPAREPCSAWSAPRRTDGRRCCACTTSAGSRRSSGPACRQRGPEHRRLPAGST